MANRDLTTTRSQVFGDVETGTECRVCGRRVTDGRAKTCSDYCGNILSAVMGMLNWSSLRRSIIARDNETCQECGFDMAREQLARWHIRDLISEKAGPRPDANNGPRLDDPDAIEDYDWDDYHDRVDAWQECRERIRDGQEEAYNALAEAFDEQGDSVEAAFETVEAALDEYQTRLTDDVEATTQGLERMRDREHSVREAESVEAARSDLRDAIADVDVHDALRSVDVDLPEPDVEGDDHPLLDTNRGLLEQLAAYDDYNIRD